MDRNEKHEYGLGGGAAGVLGLMAFSLVMLLVVVLLTSCESPAAQRERAEAIRIQAEASAYQSRTLADSNAAAERAAIREAAREAGHQRALEMLPFVVTVGGGALCLVILLLAAWDLRSRRQAPADPALLAHLRALEMQQADQWRVLADLARQEERRGMIIYDDGTR
jgi:hypothetical protein